MSLYRKIFSQSWTIAWRNKYLWFFGLFAVLVANSGAEYGIFSDLISGSQGGFAAFLRSVASTGIFSHQAAANLAIMWHADPLKALLPIIMLAVIAFLMLCLFWMSVASQTAIISNAAMIASGREHSFSTGINVGIRKFWPVLFLNIICQILILAAVFLFNLPADLGALSLPDPVSVIIYIILFLLFIPLILIISFVFKYAIGYSVIRDSRFVNSIREGWRLFSRNWLISLETAASLFILNFLGGLLVFVIAFIFFIWMLFAAVFVNALTSLTALAFVILGVGLLAVFCILALGGSFLTVFQTTVWTTLFMEIVSKGGTSKLARLFSRKAK